MKILNNQNQIFSTPDAHGTSSQTRSFEKTCQITRWPESLPRMIVDDLGLPRSLITVVFCSIFPQNFCMSRSFNPSNCPTTVTPPSEMLSTTTTTSLKHPLTLPSMPAYEMCPKRCPRLVYPRCRPFVPDVLLIDGSLTGFRTSLTVSSAIGQLLCCSISA